MFLFIIAILIVIFGYIVPCGILIYNGISDMHEEGEFIVADIFLVILCFIPIINFLASVEKYEELIDAIMDWISPIMAFPLWTRKEKE